MFGYFYIQSKPMDLIGQKIAMLFLSDFKVRKKYPNQKKVPYHFDNYSFLETKKGGYRHSGKSRDDQSREKFVNQLIV